MPNRKTNNRRPSSSFSTRPSYNPTPPGRELIQTVPSLASRLARLPLAPTKWVLPPAVQIARAIRRPDPSPWPRPKPRGKMPRSVDYLPWLQTPPSLTRQTISREMRSNKTVRDQLRTPCQDRSRRKTVLFSLGVAGRRWGAGGGPSGRFRRTFASNFSCT